MVKKKKAKQVTYRVWKENKKGDDSARSFRSVTPAAKYVLRLHKKGMFNDVVVSTGRSLLSERKLTPMEAKKFNSKVKKLAGKGLK